MVTQLVECLPVKQRAAGPSPAHGATKGYKIKFCVECGGRLNHSNKSGFCKNCKPPAKTKAEIITKYRQKRKEFLVEYKGGKCEKCGETRPWVLTFHHKNPDEKSYGIAARGTTKSIKKDLAEVDKCILLCSNCHGDFNYQNYWNKITIEEYLTERKSLG